MMPDWIWLVLTGILGWIDGGRRLREGEKKNNNFHTTDDSLVSFLVGKKFNE
tara:strand:- start:312 stop:467 length:156 start_codon:yes stop_codon:yes gene_type:complete